MTDALTVILKDTGILELTLNRPDVHNAFDDALVKEIHTALQDYKEDESVKLLLLSAEGKSFSSGADLNWMRRMKDYSEEDNYKDAKALSNMLESLENFPAPTVARVNGSAFGGGVGLIACCDIALCCEVAQFSFSEAKLGLIPAVISPFVIKAIGTRRAKHLFLTAERFDASTAHNIGLVQCVFPKETFSDDCNKFIHSLLANGPNALREIKAIMDLNEKTREIDIHDLMVERIAAIRVTPEAQEGLGAFLEKRKPSW